MLKLVPLFLIGLFATISLSAQELIRPDGMPTPTPTPTAAEKEADEKLQKRAIEFLRETANDVSNLRTAENRIAFVAELGGLMWFYDEREAKQIFAGVFTDFRELLARIDVQANSIPENDGNSGYERSMFLTNYSDKMKLDRRFSTAIAVRQQITTSIAEHDPELALNFFYDSVSALSNPYLRKQAADRDGYFEIGLLTQIVETDAAKAVQLAARSLENGYGHQHLGLLRRLYEKSPEKAIEFGQKIKNKVNGLDPKLRPDIVIGLIDYGVGNSEAAKKSPGKKPIFTDADLRELAEPVATRMLADSEQSGYYTALGFADSIEDILPSRATQLRAKYGKSPDGAAYLASRSARAASNSVRAPSPVYTSGSANANVNAARPNPTEEARRRSEEELEKNMKALGKLELPKEEREKVVAEARRMLMTTNAKDKKIMGLSLIAAQVARAGDKDLANEIMRDAAIVVNPSPKNYQDFILTWLLASGYAESDPDQAFPLIEDTIGRANSVINSFITVGEFIDVQGEMIVDGEIQIGPFGGGVVRGLSSQIGLAEGTIKTLVKADFERTKGLTNRFDRPEARVLAKMIVLRAVLGKKKEPIAVDTDF